MSKNIMTEANNKVNIVGKLMDVTLGSGTLSDGRKYERASLTVRVDQTFGGREEVSEIPLSMFATQYTKTNKVNPAYEQIQNLKKMKTAQNVGIDEADTVRVSGATLRENNFVSKSGQLINGWQINTSFIGTTNASDVATFQEELFIMDMHDEVDREGDPTGRLVIKGGIVQYGGKLDVLEFIVEQPEAVEFISRNWNVNDTIGTVGRIRVTSQEEKTSGKTSSWGEDIPETTTRFVRELIITKGDDEGHEEEFAYDPTDIKKAFNVRKALIEQMQTEATQTKPAATTASASKYSWE